MTASAGLYPDTVTYTPERMRELAQRHRLDVETIDWPYVFGVDRQVWLAFSPQR